MEKVSKENFFAAILILGISAVLSASPLDSSEAVQESVPPVSTEVSPVNAAAELETKKTRFHDYESAVIVHVR